MPFELEFRSIIEHPRTMFESAIHPQERGMPKWREKQRNLPIGQKLALIGSLIQETRRLESIKKSCKPSVTSSNGC